MRNKYRAKAVDGFPSQLEKAVYMLLLERERAKEISDIKRQQTIVLQDGGKKERITWKVDFTFIHNRSGCLWLAEAKGVVTQAFSLKLRLYRRVGKHPCEIWKGNWRNPRISEIVRPLECIE
jgi:hypothetical protein